ncbi:SCP-like protein [Aphelenchoides bicaudatus]|nr:SCP-like protein [Aphelenchoides bicaudatus]
MSESNEEDLFAYEFLGATNYYRRQHGVPELQICQDLNDMAQRHAERLAEIRHLEYFQMTSVGESITFFPNDMPASDMVDYWYKESRRYEYQIPGWQIGTNYFTQMHFNKKNGHHIEDSLNNHQVVVAFYRPAGNSNRAGQFEANVNKPIETTANNCH